MHMRRTALALTIIFLASLCPHAAAQADGLPIDIELITTPDEQQRGAVTKRRGVDVFSEAASRASEAAAARHDASRGATLGGMFAEPKGGHAAGPDAETLHAAGANGVFSKPLQFAPSAAETEADGPAPPWAYAAIFAGAAGAGLLIAARAASKKKGRARDVHNGNG